MSIDLKGNITKNGANSLILLKQKGGERILTPVNASWKEEGNWINPTYVLFYVARLDVTAQ